jgi:hypothetical protein
MDLPTPYCFFALHVLARVKTIIEHHFENISKRNNLRKQLVNNNNKYRNFI